MTVQEAIRTLQDAPIKERIQIIEMLLQSLKDDLEVEAPRETQKHFTVRTFDLGKDILPDREEMYIDRGVCGPGSRRLSR